jgi:2-keto-4-pentenoate hydratase
MVDYDPVPAARMLAAAWRSSEQLTELPVEIRPRTLNEGYAVQSRLLEDLGETAVGWKLGIASRNSMRKAGIQRAVAGRVVASRFLKSGDTAIVPSHGAITVEFEAAFILGRDVDPGEPATAQDVFSGACVTFELLRSRFVDHRAAGLPSFAADNGAFHALVVGPAIDASQIGEVVRSVIVSVDGEERARAQSGDDLIDPFQSLAGLIDHAREHRIRLRRGEIVSTGSLSRPFDIPPASATVAARFLGSELRVRIQPT